MRFLLFAVAVLAALPGESADLYAPLKLYDGTWDVSRKPLPQGAKPDVLINRCALLGQYFACAQNVNGTPGALVVFIPAGTQAGHFSVQNIMPTGRATGITDLKIEGDSWIYFNRQDQNGQTTFYRTTNTFSDKNHIHFESAESNDNKTWTVQSAGDEVRAASRASH